MATPVETRFLLLALIECIGFCIDKFGSFRAGELRSTDEFCDRPQVFRYKMSVQAVHFVVLHFCYLLSAKYLPLGSFP